MISSSLPTGTSSQNSQLLHKTSQKFTRPARQPWRSFFSIAGCVYGKKFCRSFSRCLFPALCLRVLILYKTFFNLVDENILVFRRWRCLWMCILAGLCKKKKKAHAHTHTHTCTHTHTHRHTHTHSLSFQGYLTGLHHLWERAVEVRDHLMSLPSSFFSKRNAFTHQPSSLPTYPPTRLLSSKSHFYSIMILGVLTFEEILDPTNMNNWRLWKMRH